jgi:hypothetical protein
MTFLYCTFYSFYNFYLLNSPPPYAARPLFTFFFLLCYVPHVFFPFFVFSFNPLLSDLSSLRRIKLEEAPVEFCRLIGSPSAITVRCALPLIPFSSLCVVVGYLFQLTTEGEGKKPNKTTKNCGPHLINSF